VFTGQTVFVLTTAAAAAAARVYRSSRKLYHEADSQGMRVYHDELIMGDVRMVMLGEAHLVTPSHM
jgi:hypothetical protein